MKAEKTPQGHNHIQELPKTVADKIAAGEVVDRPLSIVKELLENALDAGATSIIVEIKNGGKTYIRVTDNGCGIAKEDAALAFKRHATSKIREAEDLDQILTLGFRGEALASISAVSRTELITKTSDAKIGYRLLIEGGEVAESADTGCPDGTTIIVSDLFYNTPARLKFMKQDGTESGLIIDFISKMALAYPSVKIRLINNGNILFSTPGKGDIYANILTIYSKEIGEKLIHLTDEEGYLSVEAYVSAPSQSKTNRKSQIFFVNGRYINSKVMDRAVEDAYAEKLFEGRYPIVFLFLRVAPERVDVNIHPNKKEVRFDNDREVREFISRAIRKALASKEAVGQVSTKNLFTEVTPKEKKETVSQERVDIKKLLSERRQKERETAVETVDSVEEQPTLAYRVTPAPAQAVPAPEETAAPVSLPSSSSAKGPARLPLPETPVEQPFDILALKPLGAIFATYIMAVDDNNFYLIDQHAAHERIFYEQLLERYRSEEKYPQMLLTPFVIEIPFSLKNGTSGWQDCLSEMGFGVEEFGGKSYVVKEIPMFMTLEEAKDFIDYFLDNISEGKALDDPKRLDRIITNACKSAVKGNDRLKEEEIRQLLADLSKTRNPFSCPHGRPTFVKLSKYQIEHLFKRA